MAIYLYLYIYLFHPRCSGEKFVIAGHVEEGHLAHHRAKETAKQIGTSVVSEISLSLPPPTLSIYIDLYLIYFYIYI